MRLSQLPPGARFQVWGTSRVGIVVYHAPGRTRVRWLADSCREFDTLDGRHVVVRSSGYADDCAPDCEVVQL